MSHTTPFDQLSEASGIPIADEAASMMVTRYHEAARLAKGRRVLELACASGPGLRWLAREATLVVGADINGAMLQRAQMHYGGEIPLAQLSAEQLPFGDAVFDLIVFLEATYYVPDFEAALSEVVRVLAPGGIVFFANANPERPDFIRSPYSHLYHSADQLRRQLEQMGFLVHSAAAYAVDTGEGSSLASRLRGIAFGLARRVLEKTGLVPTTLEGRARLKRILGQRLRIMPAEIGPEFAPAASLVAVSPGPVRNYKVFYTIGSLPIDKR